MATKNYKLMLKEKTKKSRDYFEKPYPAYYKFTEKFAENKIKNGIDTRFVQDGIEFYDIQNVSVICSREDNFCVESKTKDSTKYDYGNLRITGLEENINLVEDEIKSKGFVLRRL
ncbi:MAG: hypothetical protein NTZ83_04140 [Candidatus Pacearchaeota archaeon]|nr:hypothetical protein [Candidatus Pacearchaeota archaeon]